MLRTVDGGRHWQRVILPTANLDGGYLGAQITHSTDGGATWKALPIPLKPYGGRFRAVQFATVSTGWIAGDGGALLKTTDGGATWKQQNPLDLYGTYATYLDVSFVDGLTGWVAVNGESAESYLLHTSDGGRTWERQDLPVQLVTRVVASPGGVVWVGGVGAVAQSTDSGSTWTVEHPAADAAYDGIAVVGSSVWAGGTDFAEGTGGIWRR